MSAYLDASVVVSLFVDDAHSSRIDTWVATQPTVLLSNWTVVEFSSALLHQVRVRRLTPTERGQAENAFEAWLDRRAVVAATDEDMTTARSLLRRHSVLRAADALHLAIAASQGADLATFDAGMAEAAREAGINLVRFE